MLQSQQSWLLREIEQWHAEGLISESQKSTLVKRYETSPGNSYSIILMLAGLLVGLGIILLIASNWEELSRSLRIFMILSFTVACYSLGYYLTYGRRNYPKTGIAFIFLGLLSYGAGIWLIGQMFHLSAYDATGLGLWFLGAIVMAHLTKHSLFFLFALLLLTWANLSDLAIREVSLVTGSWYYLHLLLWLFPYLYKHNNSLHRTALAISFLVVFTGQLLTYGHSLFWLTILPLGALLLDRKWSHWPFLQGSSFFSPLLLLWPLFFIQLILISGVNLILPSSAFTLIVWLILAFAVLYSGFYNEMRWESLAFLALSSPLVFFITSPFMVFSYDLANYVDIFTILLLFLGSILLIQSGSEGQQELYINSGTLFFLGCVIYAYGKFAWGLFDKSLFFIGGGLILFAVGYYMEKKRRILVEEVRGGAHGE
ncbi:DUF2157 domain-containing protein [Heliorestis acidaminivorans]|uniref:DUF2157 domain-containing protein n=1 Tax=Heliorestis acidaminivorans TaxID=553427 RepID=A0A6I0ENL1_9FIRM|nr:DUF2157 domain-containing protein [Heliorestis acidaminivorans]KAB2951367.1 DUF2157 domain-containing protein [Heliorestis acidaminivorans]